ncbi:ANTAR domain-containing protein [Nostocoides sp. F2B08]|uniref:GAF and ANTAR domain-containing protein n=1 Tax=Nostocoides sp. F2B08 TaxID=2653936 RepID=UPI0012630A7C|nr:GAF and ANTAR domain-containing protein [Tetrasphaera sp. F2B08]KAB7744792.1 ANTAR domain-containing protein [Tetrasphaera sp. F2B08]
MNDPCEDEFIALLLNLATLRANENGQRCVVATLLGPGLALFGADGGTVLLADAEGGLEVAGAASQRSQAVAVAGLRHGGPAGMAHRGLHVVSFVADDVRRWPEYARAAQAQGVRLIHAVPIEADGCRLGVFTLHWLTDVELSYEDELRAQSLARMAAVGLVNGRTLEAEHRLATQLQCALDSRVVLEQAKGMVAVRAGIDPGRAFELIRSDARDSGRPLSQVAEDIVRGIAPLSGAAPMSAAGPSPESRTRRSRRYRPTLATASRPAARDARPRKTTSRD